MMLTRRARADERRIRAQQAFECRDMAGDHGVDRRLELRDRRARVFHRLGKRGELIPALELMFPRDDRAGVALRIARRETSPPRRLHRSRAQQVAVAREQRIERGDVSADERFLGPRPNP
jgi:hypothetical protein